MHPLLHLGSNLLQIVPDALSHHAEQLARLPGRRDDFLAAGTTHQVVSGEGVGDEVGTTEAAEEGFEDEGVFDGLAGALALEGRRGVGGVAHHGDRAVGVGCGGEVVAHGPHGQVGGVEEGDQVLGRGTPAGEEGGELRGGGWEDPFVGAFPGCVLEVHGDYVEGFAEVDGIAEEGFA